MVAKLSEETQVAMPLKNIIGLVAGAAIGTWAYFGITERLSFLEHNFKMIAIEVEENDNWIDEFQPPASVQDTVKRVRQLEIDIALLKQKLESIK
tara:strand:+ start:606 stop:890 length:285 start_codon:yes stop_codon:yes gene_type:complete